MLLIGYPIGATKPGRCPGILGLGIGQPEGGYGGYGGYGGQQGYKRFIIHHVFCIIARLMYLCLFIS